MAENFVLNIPAAPDAPVSWVVVDGYGALLEDVQTGQLAEVSAHVRDRRLVILFPATQILRVNATVPVKGAAKVRQALPFALEEQLACDIDQQHFAMGKISDDGSYPVAVVENLLMHSWLEQLTADGLHPAAIYAESDGVAALPSTMTVVLHNDSVIVRDPQGVTTVADAFSMQAVLELLIEQHLGDLDSDAVSMPLNLQIYCRAEDHERYQELWERLRMSAEDVDVKILTAGALPRLAGEIVSAGGVNLLQGSFAPKAEINIDWQRWRLAATLLVAAVLTGLLAQGAQYWQLSQQEQQLNASAAQLLIETFPSAGEVDDPWAELRSRLGAASAASDGAGGPGFSEALDAFASAYEQNASVKMESLSYRSGVVSLQLKAPDVETLDKLRQSFVVAARGQFTAEILSANPMGDAIEGRMQIKLSGG